MELSDKLRKTTEFLTLGNHIIGMTATFSEPQRFVLADYFNPEFRIYTIRPSPQNEFPCLSVEQVIGNSPKTTFDGGTHVRLWASPDARAEVGQITPDGKYLLYLENGGRQIGCLDLETETILPSLGTFKGERGEYFLQLHDGRIATLEGYENTFLRLYEMVDETNLNLIRERDLKTALAYGLCQDKEDEIMFLVPQQGTYPLASKGEPGVYRLSLDDIESGEISKDKRFDGRMPADARGLVPVTADKKILGYLVSTYGFDRMAVDMGDPSKIIYLSFSRFTTQK